MKVLTRYLLRAHLASFLFAFVALTGVILINTLAKELANLAGKGLPLSVVLEFFMLSLPANIALTLPMAVLVSVLYTFSTLAAENEITALRANGVDLRRVALPLVLAAALIAGAMVWFNDQVLPTSNYRWRVLMTDVAQARPLLALRAQTINPIRTNDGTTSYYLEAQEIEAATGRLRQVAIYDVSDTRMTRTINADSGHMAFNDRRTDLLLTLYDGDVREIDFHNPENFQVVGFQRQVMRMEGVSDRLERTGVSGYRTDRDMTVGMMQARIDTLRAELSGLRAVRSSPSVLATPQEEAAVPDEGAPSAGGDPVPVAGDATLPVVDWPGYPLQDDDATLPVADGPGHAVQDDGDPIEAPLPPSAGGGMSASSAAQEGLMSAEELRYSESRARNIEYQIREYQVEIQKKYAIAAATLVFVLIGIPIAVRFPAGGLGMVIGVSVAIFGVYYVGLIGGETLGDEGYVPPALAMWATNVLFGTLGLLGYLRLGHEQGTGRGGNWSERAGWLRLPGTRWSRRRPS
jgi:lipopolysaccharide export system permease protein